MAVLHEIVETRLAPASAFDFISDFSNSHKWDPGTAWSKSVDGEPVGIGSRFRLGVRMGGRVAPMEYRVVAFEPNKRVVLSGSGSGVQATDDIRFSQSGSGTRIEYRADIRLTGLLRLIAPFAGGAFAKIAREAREGMQSTLDSLADAASAAQVKAAA